MVCAWGCAVLELGVCYCILCVVRMGWFSLCLWRRGWSLCAVWLFSVGWVCMYVVVACGMCKLGEPVSRFERLDWFVCVLGVVNMR